MENALPDRAWVPERLAHAGLEAVFRTADPGAWEQVWKGLAYQPVSCSGSMIEYQLGYLEGAGWSVEDASLVLLHDRRPCGIWPLTLGGAGEARISSNGGAVVKPLFLPGLSPRTVKRLITSCLEFIRATAETLGQDNLECLDAEPPHMSSHGISEWHHQWLLAGMEASVGYDLYTDLSLDEAEIRSAFRKSYRPLISSGLRRWEVRMLEARHCPEDAWRAFATLHRAAAGRVTRPESTWLRQLKMIRDGEAMLVYLVDPEAQERMVGGGFFQLTRDEALYAVGAYDRELFEHPLGHVVQAKAIECFKERGLRWHRLGERRYPAAATPKELTISTFKHGFATHISPRFLLARPAARPGVHLE